MRRARINYPDAYHHVMSRGFDKKSIFIDKSDKEYLLELFKHHSYRNKMKILGWCILDNHYHIILLNNEGRLSRFMREVNGCYGRWYRNKYGGKGVVFDGRFKSTVIEDDEYLFTALIYLYQNPVRAGIVKNAEYYMWSSISEMFDDSILNLSDKKFIEQFIGSKKELLKILNEYSQEKIEPFKDKWGESFGKNAFRFQSNAKNNRRISIETNKQRRKKDRIMEKPGDVIIRFLEDNNLTREEIIARTWVGSRLRGKLLLILRDDCGLKLSEINRLYPYRRYSSLSMGRLYHKAQKEND